VLDVEQVDRRLEDRYRLLVWGAADAPARHQTLQAAIEWSCALLNDAEQLLFDRLSVFRGGATLEAAESVCASQELASCDVADVLHALVENRSHRANQMMRARSVWHSLIRCARHASRGCGLRRPAALAARHLAYYARLAEQAELQLRGPTRWSGSIA
jgi:predicted ATPase